MLLGNTSSNQYDFICIDIIHDISSFFFGGRVGVRPIYEKTDHYINGIPYNKCLHMPMSTYIEYQ